MKVKSIRLVPPSPKETHSTLRFWHIHKCLDDSFNYSTIATYWGDSLKVARRIAEVIAEGYGVGVEYKPDFWEEKE